MTHNTSKDGPYDGYARPDPWGVSEKDLAHLAEAAVARPEALPTLAGLVPEHQRQDFHERVQALKGLYEQHLGTIKTVELDDFLEEDIAEPDWLITGLIERQDRLILTGNEGMGKSTFLRQLCIKAASGIHPFDDDVEVKPLRVQLFDLENSRRQVHRKIRPLRVQAGERYQKNQMGLFVRSEGLDLLDGEGALLEREVDEFRPDIIVGGPVYKLVSGDPTEEGPTRTVASWLDKLRTKYGCAVVLEAHCPYATNGRARVLRPYGASLWSRWPEFGIHLGDDGTLTHWRGPRDEREWPTLLKRGGKWPWTEVNSRQEKLWADIKQKCERAGERLSMHALAQVCGRNYPAVQRAVKAHQQEWESMA
ncbi:AAA family ATPase [Streptomyces sp. NPDC001260]|uniref:AAA family ATPase n=1 Tax=Streptomyces sp. NPDC001260 TaxID=3364551 RepID=UPI0036D13F15